MFFNTFKQKMRKDSNYIYANTVPKLPALTTKQCETGKEEEAYITMILDLLEHSKHISRPVKAMISLLFSSGIRISELLRIKGSDIDSLLNISIKGSKSSEDRVITVIYFREIWDVIRDHQFELNTFYSRFYLYREMKKIGITHTFGKNKRASVTHAPRHFHMLQLNKRGIDKKVIQKHIGHKNIKSTEIYTDNE